MSRLIDADVTLQRFIEETEASGKNVIHINTIKRLLQDIDTAYDVDAVVSELHNEAYTTTDTVCGGIFEAIRISSAIDIVKRGGVE